MRKRLSKLTLEQRAPTKGRIEIRDSESPLVFRLTSNGVRTLTVRTRFKGQQVRFTYPHAAWTENLEDARKWSHAMLDKCQAGIDPREEERKAQLAADDAETGRLTNVVVNFIERHCRKNKSWRDTQAIFRLYVLPRWGDRLITDITRCDVATLLDDVEDRTRIYRTNRVLAAIRKLFNWAMSRGMIEHSPVGHGMSCSVTAESSSAVFSRQTSHSPSGSVATPLHLPALCPCDSMRIDICVSVSLLPSLG